nr:MAG TPA: hypothetical protein [Caudoviricetes sp.]
MSTSHTKAVNSYHKRATRQYHLELHKKNDADIIRKLDTVDNKQGYIKELIRADIERGNQ